MQGKLLYFPNLPDPLVVTDLSWFATELKSAIVGMNETKPVALSAAMMSVLVDENLVYRSRSDDVRTTLCAQVPAEPVMSWVSNC